MIMIRTLRRDIARYNKEEEMVSNLCHWHTSGDKVFVKLRHFTIK